MLAQGVGFGEIGARRAGGLQLDQFDIAGLIFASFRQSTATFGNAGRLAGRGRWSNRPSRPVRRPAMRQEAGLALRRTAATASPRTMPSRLASKGRRGCARAVPWRRSRPACCRWPVRRRGRWLRPSGRRRSGCAPRRGRKSRKCRRWKSWRGPLSCIHSAIRRLNEALAMGRSKGLPHCSKWPIWKDDEAMNSGVSAGSGPSWAATWRMACSARRIQSVSARGKPK
jgi:hypothetical protein